MRHSSKVGLSLLVGLISACGGGEAPTVTSTLRDSAGVVIAENAGFPALNGGGWSVDTTPSLSIGVVEGEEAYQLMAVVGAHRSPDGTIAILDNGTRTQMTVKPGDRVLFGRFAGTEIEIDGLKNLILREDDILAIIE